MGNFDSDAYRMARDENILMSYSLDFLCVLMIEKIQTIKLLDRIHSAKEYCEAKEEINMIHKVIRIKQADYSHTQPSQRERIATMKGDITPPSSHY